MHSPVGTGSGQERAAPSAALRLKAFHPDVRRGVESLAQASPALADLAESFPALLLAIATGFATPERRAATRQLVEDGAPLRLAAQALGLPLWLRRLPAEALGGPLEFAPASVELGQRIMSHMPAEATAARTWLSAVLTSARACHDDFASWTATWAGKHHRALATPNGEQTLWWLAAWAWHSGHRETRGYRLLRRPWSPTIGHRRALDELEVWRQRVALAIVLEASGAAPRPADGRVQGYDFVALRTAEEFIVEADVMDNCLDQFADRLMQGYSRVYSVRRSGRSVADVEIGLHEQEQSMPVIRQLRGPRNRRAAPEIWQAAYAWLGGQSLTPVYMQDWRISPSKLRAASRALWEPYVAALDATGAAERFRMLVLGGAAVSAKDGARTTAASAACRRNLAT